MYLDRKFYHKLLLAILCFFYFQSHAQLGFSFDIKKPEEYDDRILGSEKSETKKFTLPRRLTQNAFTHYNYAFNAKNKLNLVLENAKAAHFDDYTELLPFYNYTLDQTASDSLELDSIIAKTTTGIVLHDLRNEWIDNLYLLQGAAYYLGKQFDSAYLTFQFINYAFAKKEKDGYYQTIGSKFDGNNALSISTKEKNSLPRRAFSEPPSRNDAFIWQIRTLIAMEEYAEAASLIITLRDDPEFPKRLKNDLEEVQAWWFYKGNVYDSAAVHLEKALSNATNKKERARWEFLIAQLYERSGKLDLAREFYDKVINHTIDPVMEIYARLHSIRINKTGGDNYIDRNIAELLKMARRDKYYDYRDVIYYTIAQMELERNNFDAALANLKKSTENSVDNPALKNKAFLQMADLAFSRGQYREAKSLYDSIDIGDTGLKNADEIRERKQILNNLVAQLDIAERQDSLQRIAAMPEEARRDFVRKLVRKLRKESGLKEDPSTSPLVPIGTQKNDQTDLFTNNSSKGDWYFYNTAIRTKGAAEFKARWGNRPNVDNWRRAAGMSFQQANKNVPNQPSNSLTQPDNKAASGEITFDALYDNLPLTDKQMELSNDSLSEALYKLGKSYANDLEDCASSLETNQEIVERFPTFKKLDEVLFTLYYCYKKSGDAVHAEQVKKMMEQKFGDSRLTKIVTTGKDPGSSQNPEATRAYEDIYNLFIEGNFEKAVADKLIADSLYGSTYWTPQLMYIESVYYIKQKDDAKATEILNAIIAQKPNTPMAAKAAVMIDVLSRRQKIENELAGLDVRRVEEKPLQVDTSTVQRQDTVVFNQLPPKEKPQDVVKAIEDNPVVKAVDTVVNRPMVSSYSFKPDDKYYAAVVLTKVDMVWVNETKNAFNIYNRGKFYNQQFELSTAQLNPEYKLVLIGNFDNAQAAADYVQTVKPVSNSQIVPWLAAEKYSFTIISASNLEILKIQQDIGLYKQFIEKNMPGKF